MSDRSLYGIVPVQEDEEDMIMNVVKEKASAKSTMEEVMYWLAEIATSDSFQRMVVRTNVLPTNDNRDQAMRYVLKCTKELLGHLIKSLGEKFHMGYIHAMAAACFILSFKLLGGYDWMRSSRIHTYMAKKVGVSTTRDKLIQMEGDILARTEWKGCPTARISEENILLGGRKRNTRRARSTRTRRNHKK